MIGRLLLVGLFFIGMINGQPQRLQTSLDALDEGLDWLNEQIEKNNREKARKTYQSIVEDCEYLIYTKYVLNIFSCKGCLKQKFDAFNPEDPKHKITLGQEELEQICKKYFPN